MTDVICAPVCDPGVATTLTSNTPPPPPSAPSAVTVVSSCATPVFVQMCNPSEFDNNILCDPTTGAKVVVVTSYSNAGVPSSTAYNLDGTPYVGPISALIACGGSGEESDPVIWCRTVGLVRTNVTQWVVKSSGAPTGVVYWTDSATGVAIAPPLPSTVTQGTCRVDADADAGHSAFVGTIDTALNAGVGVLVSPAVGEGPWHGLTVFNKSNTMTLRVTIAFVGQTVGTNDHEMLIPANGTASAEFDNDTIQQFTAQYVALPAVSGVVTGQDLVAPPSLVGQHQFIANVVNA